MVLPQKPLFTGALPLGFESIYAAVPNGVHPSLGQTCRQSGWHKRNMFIHVWWLMSIQSAKFITLCRKGLQRERCVFTMWMELLQRNVLVGRLLYHE